jgi:Tol biopolymer transport system component
LRKLVERCLERDPKLRLRDIGEARIALEAIATGEVEPPPVSAAPRSAGRRGVSLPIFAAVLVGAVAVAVIVAGRWAKPAGAAAPGGQEVTEFSIAVDGLTNLALSPDGRKLAWATRSSDDLGIAPWTESGRGSSTMRLWVRDLNDRTPREVASDPDLRQATWAPDGSQLAVQIGEKLWRVSAAGGERSPICDLPLLEGVSGRGVLAGAWLPDDTLLFAAWRGGIYRVPARGGVPELEIPIDPKVDVDFHQIVLLPDNESLLLLVHPQMAAESGDNPKWRLELFRNGRREPLSGSEELSTMAPLGIANGTLVLADVETTESSAWGVPFDARRGAVTGKKLVLIPRLEQVSVGSDGTFAYVPPRERPSVVARVDRAGAEVARFGEPHPHLDRLALSPDGSKLAVVLNLRELWVRDLGRGTLTRLVTEPKEYIDDPQWSPDGRAIYYAAGNSTNFRRIRPEPGAVPETVFDDAFRAFLAPDASGVVLRQGGFKLSENQGLYWVPFDAQGRPGERRKLLGGLDSLGRLAPGGKLLAYSEGISGKREAYLTAFPTVEQTIQLSANGGGTPQWSADGTAVYYLAGGALIEVEVSLDAAGRLTAAPERKLFELAKVGLRSDGWRTAPDGDGFLFLKSLATDDRSEIVVVRNGLQRATASTR